MLVSALLTSLIKPTGAQILALYISAGWGIAHLLNCVFYFLTKAELYGSLTLHFLLANTVCVKTESFP